MPISLQSKRQIRLVKPSRNIEEMYLKEKQQIKQKSMQKKSPNLNRSSRGPSSQLKTRTLKDEICTLLQSAKVAKEKINKGLEFVKLIDNFNQEQRCLDHNNVITLYCMNDKKLLCVYCIYGVHKHRAHKLLPPLQHLEYISKDVFDLQKSFNEYLFGLQDVIINSKMMSSSFQNLMKKYLSEIEVEYIRRKLELQQTYELQKNYITKTCQQFISNTKFISNEYEQIKFNIWECQARYNLDKKLKFSQGSQNQNTQQTLTFQSNFSKANINRSKSPSKKTLRPQIQKDQTDPLKKTDSKNQKSVDSQKDYRQILSKHIILSHIVEEMKKIEPFKIQEKVIEKKLFNRAMLKLISHKPEQNDRTLSENKGRKSLSLSRK